MTGGLAVASMRRTVINLLYKNKDTYSLHVAVLLPESTLPVDVAETRYKRPN